MLGSFVPNSRLLQYLIDALLRPLGGTPEGVVEAALAQGRGQALDRRACIGPSSSPLPPPPPRITRPPAPPPPPPPPPAPPPPPRPPAGSARPAAAPAGNPGRCAAAP